METVKSAFGKFNVRDIIHGFLVAFLTASCTGLLEMINSGHLPTVEALIVHAKIGLTAGIGYVLKVLLENSKGQFLKKEQ